MAGRIASPKVAISSSQRSVRVPRKRIASLVRFLARQEGAAVAEVDIAVVSRGEMARLNRRWFGRSGATDVISFDLSEAGAPGIAAQLIVCGDAAARRAARRGGGVQRELMLYVVHGLLHLIGYDDRPARRAARMRAREQELLEAFLRKGRRRRKG